MKKRILLFSAAAVLQAQTVINGSRTIKGAWDASGATATAPFVTGSLANLPSTCNPGEGYFVTNVAPGQNLYLCTSANTWTQQLGGGSGGGGAAGSPITVVNGGGLKVSGSPVADGGTLLLSSDTPVISKAGSYTFADSDRGSAYLFTGAATATLPQAGGSGQFLNGWSATVINAGSGVVSVSPTASTINNMTALVLAPWQWVKVISDGTNYWAQTGHSGTIRFTGTCTTCSYSGATANTVLKSIAVPANLMGTGDAIRFTAFYSHTGTSTAPRVAIALGGSTPSSSGGSATYTSAVLQGTILITGSTTEEGYLLTAWGGGSSLPYAAPVSWSANVASNLNLDLEGWFTTTTLDSINLRGWIVEILKAQ